jgi:hypothetical protein
MFCHSWQSAGQSVLFQSRKSRLVRKYILFIRSQAIARLDLVSALGALRDRGGALPSGFKVTRTDNFTVTVEARQRVDMVLEIAEQATALPTRIPAAVLETKSSDRGEVIGQHEIVNLPINGREIPKSLPLLIRRGNSSSLLNFCSNSRS